MWAPNRTKPSPHRTPSIVSIASVQSATRPLSVHSPKMNSMPQMPQQQQQMPQMPQLQAEPPNYDSDAYSDLGSDDEQDYPSRMNNPAPLAWNRPQAGSPANLMAQKMQAQVQVQAQVVPPPQTTNLQFHNQPRLQQRPVDDDATSRSSTLDGEEDDTYSLKKPAAPPVLKMSKMSIENEKPAPPPPVPHVPGPLESQLAALMSKLIHIEQTNPVASVTPEEFLEMKNRLKALEEEKKVWWKRHEAIWSLRDEDVENNIKIRGMLAKARRELEATQKLRDEDLVNVQIVRSKLAEKTRELERLQAQSPAGRISPNRPRMSSFLERRDTTDLFTAAKIAALEQRALELEKRNSDLVEQLGASQNGGIDHLNRTTAHQAWKGTVTDLETKIRAQDAELQRLRSGAGAGAATPTSWDFQRLENLMEEHANYREDVGGKMQALRSEKEALMRDLHRKENDCHVLEQKVRSLQRRSGVM
ncbi:hypothetical protein COCVIDRAFT_87303 [Bipolaris victoriae FI3]|uniref:Uncharacterized protein n=1 Tax=Bipolaris victoriae (strain FI3) TaxID=930091 RepID=W7F0J1_BIPV3|nr:hypothetical protein COCVIDRAFT_87303 [Bipolaris victoriae FI3]